MKARIAALLTLMFLGTILALADSTGYVQTNLVSDGSVSALHTDASLINPWGITFTGTSPFWVGDNGTGLSTIYNSTGVKQGLTVTIQPGGGTGAPTGVAFNNTAKLNGDLFIFATENGNIQGWKGALGTTAEVLYNSSFPKADYTGLALDNGNVYAADNNNNRIEVFVAAGNPSITGNFIDPTIPAGYSVFNIQKIGTSLFVTYAPGSGLGNGFVSEFSLNGDFVRRVTSDLGLDSPWGLAVAPTAFGQFGGDLLVGNFGNGKINAFDFTTGALLGTLTDPNGVPIVNESLWALTFGNGGNGGDKNTLYFSAGLAKEEHGLFGAIAFIPEPTSMVLLGSGLAGVVLRRKRLS